MKRRPIVLGLCLCLSLALLLMPVWGCGGAAGGGGGAPVGGAAILLDLPVKWIDNDNDSLVSTGDVLVLCFDRSVEMGANAPTLDLAVVGGAIVTATWTNGFLGDGNKMTLNVTAGDTVTAGKLLAGTTFNLAGGNTLTNPVDGTIGATPAGAAQSVMGNILDTGQNLGAITGRSIALADTNSDGVNDVILGTPGANLILLNNGAGLFGAGPAIVGEILADTRGIGVGFIDFDLIPDFVAANSGVPNANLSYLNTAPGTYTNTGVIGRDVIGGTNSNGVYVTNGFFFPTWDMLMGGEMFVANNGVNMVYYANAAGLFDGDGTLAVIPGPQAIGGATDTRAVVGGDLDVDGDDDVVICDDMGLAAGVVTRYLVTPGAGTIATFTAAVLAGTLPEPRSLALCDVDEDTDLDLVVGYDNGGGMQIFTNNGAGVLTLVTTIPGGNVLSLTCTDVDGDGFDDIIQGRGANQGIAIWINCGAGTFVDSMVTFPGNVNGIASSGSQSPTPAQPIVGHDGGGRGDFVTADGGGTNKAYVSGK